MVLEKICDLGKNSRPLKMVDLPEPVPGEGEIVIKVSACGVCHTELDEIEGRTPPPMLPMVLGHQAVGRVAATGTGATRFGKGDRVGVAWIFSACGICDFCMTGRENLCASFMATGRDANGGYAEFMRVSEGFAYAIPDGLADGEVAPLLCAGAIGYRSLRLTEIEDGQRLGLTGFGASAHLVLKMVNHCFSRSKVFVFARSKKERAFAIELGASWSGDIGEMPPENLDAIIDTTPVWKPVMEALLCLKPGGRLVINAIRKESKDNDVHAAGLSQAPLDGKGDQERGQCGPQGCARIFTTCRRDPYQARVPGVSPGRSQYSPDGVETAEDSGSEGTSYRLT